MENSIQNTYYVRLDYDSIVNDDYFNNCIEALKEQNIKAVTFFSSFFHSLPKFEIIETFANKFKERVKVLREIKGLKIGINVFLTLGFFKQNIEDVNKEVQWAVNKNGGTSFGRACINDLKARNFIERVYKILAESGPDFMLVDDDMGCINDYLCYCPTCLKKFEEKTGLFAKNNRAVTREDLVEILNGDKKAKELWYDNYRKEECEIYSLIERTVHKVNPNIELGYMVYGDYAKTDLSEFAMALRGNSAQNISIRPGGGLYNDDVVEDIYAKMGCIARQINNLPPFVNKIESEIECFPGNILGKSDKYIEMEALLYNAVGCTGTAYSITPTMRVIACDPLYYERLQIPNKVQAFSGEIIGQLQNSRPVGVFLYTGDDTEEDMDRVYDRRFDISKCLMSIGVPVAFCSDRATVNMISREMAEKLSEQEIKKAFSLPVIIEGEALEILNNRGFSDYTGAKVEEVYAEDTLENCIKTQFAGVDFSGTSTESDCVQAFSWFPTYRKTVTFSLLGKGEYLAQAITFNRKKTLGYTLAKTVNKFGQKVVISGYSLFPNYKTHLSLSILRDALFYLQEMPFICSCHKINMIMRKTDNGKNCLFLTNMSLDDVKDVLITLPKNFEQPKELVCYDNGNTVRIKIDFVKENDFGKVYKINNIPYLTLGYIL